MLTFTQLGLDPAYNMLPDGAMNLGAPCHNAEIRFKDKKTEMPLKRTVLVNCIARAMSDGEISRTDYPMLVAIIQKDGHVHTSLNRTNVADIPVLWDNRLSCSKLKEKPKLLSELVQALEVKNIAVFYETKEGGMMPVWTSMKEKLEYWEKMEFVF